MQSLPEKDGVVTEFAPTSVDVRVNELDGKNHCFSIRETCHAIRPDASFVKVKSDSVSVLLAKADEGKKWAHLRASEAAAAKAKSAAAASATAPKADDPAATADPQAGIMNLMKQMYDDGDDEMKRTIAKAWTESRDKEPGDGGDGHGRAMKLFPFFLNCHTKYMFKIHSCSS